MDSKELSKFKDIHLGKRAFLVAGGPSLDDVDMSQLEGELVFSVSLTFKKGDFRPNYHFIGDAFITKQFYKDINEMDCDALFMSDGIEKLNLITHPNVHYFTGHGEKRFHYDVTKPIYGGGTSTFLAMQFAFFMGIQNLYAIGLDHSWKYNKAKKVAFHQGKDIPLMETEEEDINHFGSEFYPKGTQWYMPKVDKMAKSYNMAREFYEVNGRKIYNASTKTSLHRFIIPRIRLEDVWHKK